MKNLIVPIAGKSSRFPGLRPKWMLTHPSGNLMVIESILGLNLTFFDKIYFVFLREHEEQFKFLKSLKKDVFEYDWGYKVHFVQLISETRNQPETVFMAIKQEKIQGSVFIKDSDNQFSAQVTSGNSICVHDLNHCKSINPSNKSYVKLSDENLVVNIVEKKVISSLFCVGGYGFESTVIFQKTYEKLKDNEGLYISDLIFQIIVDGGHFYALHVNNYADWGTIEDWDNYKRSFATLFIDIDGTLFYNSSSHFPPYYGDTGPITENIEIIKKLRDSGRFQIILTTSRREEFRDLTVDQMRSIGLDFDYLLMDLYHSKRIIINDFAKSNPFKSCDAINIKRDSKELHEILKSTLGIDLSQI
jgi:hypothetical protein